MAVGKHGSIAVVERFIRSMKKEGLRRLLIPLCQMTFLQQLWFYIAWYNEHRPHTALRGATPNERYFGRRAANRAPRFEPRASWPRGAPCAKPQKLIKGQPGTRIELAVMFEAGRKHLPVIALRRVAWSISGFACHGSPRSRCAIGPAFRCQRIQLRFSNTSKPYVSPLKHAENRRSTTPFALTQGKRNFGEPVQSGSKPRAPTWRVATQGDLRRRWDSYPAGTTLAGAGLSPAGTAHLFTAHLDQHSRSRRTSRSSLVASPRAVTFALIKLFDQGDNSPISLLVGFA